MTVTVDMSAANKPGDTLSARVDIGESVVADDTGRIYIVRKDGTWRNPEWVLTRTFVADDATITLGLLNKEPPK